MAILGEPRQKRNLIPLKKALERGGFGRTKAYELINEGKIIAYKMGGQTMVDADSIDAYHMSLPRIEPGT
ncbi:helix-turn-helix domain-containing protein [Bradyrhizobium sp. CER78]|uniref:helix-turn-helix domain-containing protein n=1 Tax=Bradyrhizobium sp. CER78 TaxID=3039162 RepID=UPI00244B91C6|nr:helix-turn-helix domain-containing protein [Bradyrhizobium sp. CER78]MDH2380825.1 helix-turn-helix domain-containing protein [Bradyrhizobium sp. CER78]